MNLEPLGIEQAERISEIEARCYIHRAWREQDGARKLVVMDWTDWELPNGLFWHIARFQASLARGGAAFGCFDGDVLVGYAVADAERFGSAGQYILLDQLFVSESYRRRGIGKALFHAVGAWGKERGARSLFLCAGSSEDTIAFYHHLGCVEALEINPALREQDPNDWQLECPL